MQPLPRHPIRKHRLLNIVFFGFFLLLPGLNQGRQYSSVFDVVAENIGSTKDIVELKIRFPGFQFNFGEMSDSGGKSYSLFQGRWPERLHAEWRMEGESSGTPAHTADVLVPSIRGAKRSDYYQLIIEVDGENVVAHPLLRDDY